jgi:hypothetical protein
MNKIVVGPVPGYEHVKFLPKKQAPKRNLKWHTSYGTIYVYDDQGNSCSISRGNNGTVDVDHMYSDGEELKLWDCDYDFFNHVLCPFTEQELQDFIDNYMDYVGFGY